MSTLGLVLLLVSACIHLVTHVAIKASRNRDAFVWWMLLWDAVLFAPVLVLLWEPFPAEAWKYILLSSIFEATYFFAIGKAYRGGDLSVVYPLARGSAVVFLLIWSVTLLHEQLTRGGVGGVLVVRLKTDSRDATSRIPAKLDIVRDKAVLHAGIGCRQVVIDCPGELLDGVHVDLDRSPDVGDPDGCRNAVREDASYGGHGVPPAVEILDPQTASCPADEHLDE